MGDLMSVTSIIEQQPLLLDDRDSDSRYALHYAAEIGDLEIIEYIINKYSSTKKQEDLKQHLNAMSSIGETPLMLAASQGHHEAVRLLISKGGDVNVTASNGQTALDKAAEAGFPSIVKALIKNNANTEISKVYYQTRLRNLRSLQQRATETPQ
jgi:ankyrin repeat protein